MAKRKEIILGVTGSIAAYKACEIIRRLKDLGCGVTVVMTKEAKEFVRPLTFSRLSQNRVYAEMFSDGRDFDIEHVSLAQKADLILVAPATANIIAKLASGICDDLLSCVILASKTKVLICPAMDENMYTNKITQENIEKLKKLDYQFIGPVKGKLASGKIGIGRLAEIEEIIKEVKVLLK
jgi:phosphopantothenoylcysteine decarboxylase/phosphopantothenate--cysteine ligase